MWVTDLLSALSRWLREYVDMLALAMTATVLIIFGGDINRWVKRKVNKYNFAIRLLVFVLLCAVGYGLATIYTGHLVADFLRQINDVYLFPLIVLLLIGLGLIAENKQHM